MHASAEGTERYVERFPAFRSAGFYRPVEDLRVSSLGIGTYLGGVDDLADRAYTDALIAAGESGVNFFDTAINYRHQRSERCIGAALRRLQSRVRRRAGSADQYRGHRAPLVPTDRAIHLGRATRPAGCTGVPVDR